MFLISAATLLLIIAFCAVYFSSLNHQAIQVTVPGYFYDSSNDNMAEQCSVFIDGRYDSSFFHEGSFIGNISIVSDSIEISEKYIEFCFENSVAIPKTEDEWGHQYTSRIHSIIQNEKASALVIVLYNKYDIKDDSVTGSFDKSLPIFICVGDISKAEAQNLICSHYGK